MFFLEITLHTANFLDNSLKIEYGKKKKKKFIMFFKKKKLLIFFSKKKNGKKFFENTVNFLLLNSIADFLLNFLVNLSGYFIFFL
jgi:hypothetical protein